MMASLKNDRCVRLSLAALVCLGVLVTSGCAGAGEAGSPSDERLYLAAERGDLKGARRLVAGGATVNAPHTPNRAAAAADGTWEADSQVAGQTPLHIAASRGHKNMVEYLLQNGADVNAQDANGNTPLHLSAARGHEKCTEEILVKGPNPLVRNNAGKTAAEVATRDTAPFFSARVK